MQLAWGQKVSGAFATKVIELSGRLFVDDPSWFMACMAFETGETFSPSVRNGAGSGAIGLIQFMPSTAAAMGTTVEILARLTAEDQLFWVERYFKPWEGKLHTLGDIYAVILWPGMIGKSDSDVIFSSQDANRPKLYLQNKGLDVNHDGHITKAEVVSRVQQELVRGLAPSNVLEIA